jgi:hypothetical protein
MGKKNHDKATLRCSFCGKSQNEVKKLIAGPTVYICNECIDICVEIIHDDEQIKEDHNSAIRDYLRRASDDLEAARLLAAHAKRRVAVDLSRTSAQSSLMAYEVLRSGQVSYTVFEELITVLLRDDNGLRRVEGLNVTPLLKEYRGCEEIGESDLEGALETARLIYEYVFTKVAA